MTELSITATLSNDQWMTLDRALTAAMNAASEMRRKSYRQRDIEKKAGRDFMVRFYDEGIERLAVDFENIRQLRSFFDRERARAIRDRVELERSIAAANFWIEEMRELGALDAEGWE